MSKEYLKAVQEGVVLDAKHKRARKLVVNELQELGLAFESVIKDKYHVQSLRSDTSYLPSAVDALTGCPSRQNTVGLQLVVNDGDVCKIPALTCAFEPNGCYPCVLRTEGEAKVCSSLAELKRTLLSSCGTIGASLSHSMDDLTRQSSAPVVNAAVDCMANAGDGEKPTGNVVQGVAKKKMAAKRSTIKRCSVGAQKKSRGKTSSKR